MPNTSSILWFKDIDKDDIPIVGGKGANLGEMVKANFPVPNGFVVTAQAYFAFLREHNLTTKINHLLQTIDFNKPESLMQVSSHIKKVIVGSKMSEELAHEIFKAYRMLSGSFSDAYVAVRSSATAEDLPGASFAGQQETFLNVHGEANLALKVKDAWASLFESRAIFYRHEQKYDHFRVGIAIVVQKMVDSDKSGIMFTIDPVTNAKSTIVVEAIDGLGEVIVQGQVTPDHYEVDKQSLEIKIKSPAVQNIKLIKSKGTNKEVKIPEKEGKKQKLTDNQILAVASLGKQLERHYYFPQDIEWAIEKGKVYIVQTRPITTIETTKKTDEKQEKISLPLLLTGAPASPGIASGPVKILHSPKDIGKIVPGDILVAPQTNPDFVPGMKKAAAIITDKGGRTCFGASTQVLTDSGFLTMEELYNRSQASEPFSVYSYDYHKKKPTWKRVVSTQKNRLSAVTVSVSQTGRVPNNVLNVTEDHKFFTYQARELIKKPLSQILLANEAVCVVDSLPQVASTLETSNRLAYLLGAICTDGCIDLQMGVNTWRRGTVIFTQKQSEQKQEFIQTVNSYFSEIFQKELRPRDKYTHSYIRGRLVVGTATDYRCHSLSIALEMKKLVKDLPTLASSFSEGAALHFLAGVIDGDGSFYNNRIQIYAGKKSVLEGVLISCLRLGIFPQITVNRSIYNIQILERMSDILAFSKKITVNSTEKELGNKLFAAKQIFEGVHNEVNYKGRVKPYISNNLLIDGRKIKAYILPKVDKKLKLELSTILGSSLRMQRIKKEKDLGIVDVYNIEVEADNELDHNYIVFTSRYTPLLVSNSHAAIVSRELGIPAIVGTEKATAILKNEMIVTVNGALGEIYQGGYTKASTNVTLPHSHLKTATKVYVNLAQPDIASKVALQNVDGIGLLRAEFIMANIGVHPKKMIREGKKKEYIEKLTDALTQFCEPFNPRPVVYRTSDFKTNEYRGLVGGKEYEPVEPNPMLGFRGAFRYMHDPEVFELELEAIKIVRNERNFKNLSIMLPFVRTVHELKAVKRILSQNKLHRSPSFKLWMMVEIPSNVIMLEKFIEAGIDGVSIGSNDLTMLLLGTDRDNSEVAQEFDEMNPSVLWALEHVIKTAHKHKITTSICGQAPSMYPELVDKLVNWGVTSISVSPDVVDSVRETVVKVEKKMLGHKE